ncbi:MAG: KH domain-containing protein [Candidatus Moraniibacteriota bacterium]
MLITLDVNPKDMGMVIGREGMTAKALRTLLRVIGARNNARVNLKINEPEGGERPPRPDRSPRREEGEAPAETHPAEPTTPEKRTLDEVMNDIQI